MSQRKDIGKSLPLNNDSSSPQFNGAEQALQDCMQFILYKLTMLYDESTAHHMLVTYIEDLRYDAHTWDKFYRNKNDLYLARDNIIIPMLSSADYKSHWADLDALKTLTSTSGKNLLSKIQKNSQEILMSLPAVVTEDMEEEETEKKGINRFISFVGNLFKENNQIEEQKVRFKIGSKDPTSGKVNFLKVYIYISSTDKTIGDLKTKLSKQTGIDAKHLEMSIAGDFNLPNDALWRDNENWYGIPEGKPLIMNKTPANNNKNDTAVVVGSSYTPSPVSTSTVPMTTAATILAAATGDHTQPPQAQELNNQIEEQKVRFRIHSWDPITGKMKHSGETYIDISSSDQTIGDLKIKLSKQTGSDIEHLDIMFGRYFDLPNNALWRNDKWYGLPEGKAFLIDKTPLNNKNDTHIVVGSSYAPSPVSTSTVPMTTAATIPAAATTVEPTQPAQAQERALNLASGTFSTPTTQPYQEHYSL